MSHTVIIRWHRCADTQRYANQLWQAWIDENEGYRP